MALSAAVEGLLGKFKILDWDREAAAIYGKLRAETELAGVVLSNLDLLIAAHAVATKSILVSRNGAFRQLGTRCELENWAVAIQGLRRKHLPQAGIWEMGATVTELHSRYPDGRKTLRLK